MAHLKPVAAGILEEDRVVSRLVKHRAFDIPRAGIEREPGQAIDLAVTLRPKGDAVFVRHVGCLFGHAKESARWLAGALVLQPVFHVHPAGKTECRKQDLIKRGSVFEQRHTQVDVIVEARHGKRFGSSTLHDTAATRNGRSCDHLLLSIATLEGQAAKSSMSDQNDPEEERHYERSQQPRA